MAARNITVIPAKARIGNRITSYNVCYTKLLRDVLSQSTEVIRTFTVLASPFDTITAGVTTVKADHIKKIRNAVNTARNYYCLSTFTWNGEITAGRTTIKDWPFP